VLQDVAEKYGIEGSGRKRKRTVEVHRLIDVTLRVRRVLPINANAVRYQLPVDSVVRDLATAAV
jgi:hypothetical protein